MEGLASGEEAPPETTEVKVATMLDEQGEAPPGTVTADEDVQKLDAYDAIDLPDGVTPETMKTAQGKVKEAMRGKDIDPAKYAAHLAEELNKIEAAQGTTKEWTVDEIRELTEKAVGEQVSDEEVEAAKAEVEEYKISDDAFVPEVEGVEANVSETKEAEENTRKAITGKPASEEEAQIVGEVGYEAHQRKAVKGKVATKAAADMIAETGKIPGEIAAAVVEDPATVIAQLDNQPVEVRAAFAALPTEALVSGQMEALTAGMDEGNPPAWARPAIAAVEQMMAARGMSASTVGRDALFNAVIQGALPMAQSNARALQERGAQNLSNQQQANIEQSRQDMTRRMANLANRQTSESQSAQFAQNMGEMQSQFKQQARMETAGQQQQMRMQNLANRQESSRIESQNQQEMYAKELDVEHQVNLAELQIESETEGANQAAVNQERLAEFQVAAEFMSKNAEFTQQMKLANLSTDQQMRLANLSHINQAESENLTAAQQTELANLNSRLQTNLLQGQIAAEMNVAQLSVDQQRAVENASMVAKVDMTKFSAAQQVELANSKWMQTASMANLDNKQQAALMNATNMAQLDLAAVDQRTKMAVTNANNFLAMDMANLNNRQQGVVLDAQLKQQRILSDQSSLNAAEQFNSTSENQTNQFNTSMANQMEQFNSSQANQMEQFNTSETNRMSAIQAGNQLEADKFNNQIYTQLKMFDEEMDYRRDSWNAANAQAVEQSNVEWRRKANTIDTAAQNAANQQNAAFAFDMSKNAQNNLWQEVRDQATFDFQKSQNAFDRGVNVINAALSNSDFLSYGDLKGTRDKIFRLLDDLG